MGNKGIEDGMRNLHKLESLLEKAGLKMPSFKMVLTSGDLAYMKDGVSVVPIGCLRN
jgi:hypothetical protein